MVYGFIICLTLKKCSAQCPIIHLFISIYYFISSIIAHLPPPILQTIFYLIHSTILFTYYTSTNLFLQLSYLTSCSSSYSPLLSFPGFFSYYLNFTRLHSLAKPFFFVLQARLTTIKLALTFCALLFLIFYAHHSYLSPHQNAQIYLKFNLFSS